MAVYDIPAYPKTVHLRDNTSVTIRPLSDQDEAALLKFFLAVPEGDRFYLKDDVTSPDLIKRWTRELDYRRALPLIALLDDRIVAEAVLVRRRGNARSHVGEVRVTVTPECREKGLGTTLVRELCDIADDEELEKVVFEAVTDKEEDAIQAMEALGFLRAGLIEGGARDQQGHLHDIMIMVMPLGKWYEWSKY